MPELKQLNTKDELTGYSVGVASTTSMNCVAGISFVPQDSTILTSVQ